MFSGCVSAPPDVPVCVSLGETSGYCINTVSNTEQQVGGDAWQIMKKDALILPSDSWAKLKVYILEMCQQYGNCPAIQKKIDLLTLKEN
jgi:hypothetical protein